MNISTGGLEKPSIFADVMCVRSPRLQSHPVGDLRRQPHPGDPGGVWHAVAPEGGDQCKWQRGVEVRPQDMTEGSPSNCNRFIALKHFKIDTNSRGASWAKIPPFSEGSWERCSPRASKTVKGL